MATAGVWISNDLDKKVRIINNLDERSWEFTVPISVYLIWNAYRESKWTTIGSPSLEVRSKGRTKETSSQENSKRDY